MASSLSSKPFLRASRTDGASGLGSLPSDLRKLSSPTFQISFRPRPPRKLEIQAVGSSFGTYFRVTTYGESHGGGVGCVIDGCPPRLPLSESDMQIDLDRRRPGQSRITTPRKETDTCQIYSGVAEGVTTGSPIHVSVPNTDQRGLDYSEMSIAYRPSHADATYDFKYGVRSVQGGGRSSARETIGRVAAGAVAKKILKKFSGTEVLAYVSQVHKVVLPENLIDHETLTLDQIESNIVRCPDPEYAEKMIAAIDAVRVRGDSVGGVVTCIVRNVPRGLRSPVFDKLEAELVKAALSLQVEEHMWYFGLQLPSKFHLDLGTFMTGSEHNDEFFTDEHGRIRTRTNRSGGIQVVRYHSLVIDAESLPKELIPIAWTSSTDTLSFLETSKFDVIPGAYERKISQNIAVESFSTKSKNGSSWPSAHSEGMQRRNVLMGIMHSTRPHYGVQFHPESVATCYGRQIFKNFREMTVDYWLRLRSSFLNERKGHYNGAPCKSTV